MRSGEFDEWKTLIDALRPIERRLSQESSTPMRNRSCVRTWR